MFFDKLVISSNWSLFWSLISFIWSDGRLVEDKVVDDGGMMVDVDKWERDVVKKWSSSLLFSIKRERDEIK